MSIDVVAIQLAPTAGVTPGLRSAVVGAVEGAGLRIDHWIPLPGEIDPTVEGKPAAQPHLQIFIEGPTSDQAAKSLSDVSTAVCDALAQLRAAEPSLPLGIRTLAPDRQRWLGYRPGATPETIRRSAAEITVALMLDEDALGWDEIAGRWVAL